MEIVSLFIYSDSLIVHRLNNDAFLTAKVMQQWMRYAGDCEWSISIHQVVTHSKDVLLYNHLQGLRKLYITSVCITGIMIQTTYRFFKTNPLHLSIVQLYWNHYVSEFGSISIFCPQFESWSTEVPRREEFCSMDGNRTDFQNSNKSRSWTKYKINILNII